MAFINSSSAEKTQSPAVRSETASSPPEARPAVIATLQILGWLSLIGGCLNAFIAESAVWLGVAIGSAALWWALAAIIDQLAKIVERLGPPPKRE